MKTKSNGNASKNDRNSSNLRSSGAASKAIPGANPGTRIRLLKPDLPTGNGHASSEPQKTASEPSSAIQSEKEKRLKLDRELKAIEQSMSVFEAANRIVNTSFFEFYESLFEGPDLENVAHLELQFMSACRHYQNIRNSLYEFETVIQQLRKDINPEGKCAKEFHAIESIEESFLAKNHHFVDAM